MALSGPPKAQPKAASARSFEKAAVPEKGAIKGEACQPKAPDAAETAEAAKAVKAGPPKATRILDFDKRDVALVILIPTALYGVPVGMSGGLAFALIILIMIVLILS